MAHSPGSTAHHDTKTKGHHDTRYRTTSRVGASEQLAESGQASAAPFRRGQSAARRRAGARLAECRRARARRLQGTVLGGIEPAALQYRISPQRQEREQQFGGRRRSSDRPAGAAGEALPEIVTVPGHLRALREHLAGEAERLQKLREEPGLLRRRFDHRDADFGGDGNRYRREAGTGADVHVGLSDIRQDREAVEDVLRDRLLRARGGRNLSAGSPRALASRTEPTGRGRSKAGRGCRRPGSSPGFTRPVPPALCEGRAR